MRRVLSTGWWPPEQIGGLLLRIVVPLAVGGVLIAAGVLKAIRPADEELILLTALPSRLVHGAVSAVEFSLGMALVVGLWPRFCRWVAILLFAAFTAVTAYRLWDGREDCGCFGSVSIHPAATLTLDGLACVGLAVWCPRPSRGAATRAGAWAAVCVAAASVWLAFSPGPSPGPTADRDPVVLDPPAWRGQPFPLTPYLDGGVLTPGLHTVVLVRERCGTCERLVAHLRGGDARTVVPDGWPVTLVVLPALGQGFLPPASRPVADTGFVTRVLPADREWLGRTPVVLWLSDGIVIRVFPADEVSGLFD